MTDVTYSPSHRQAGAPTINFQSTLRTAPDSCKNISLYCHLVATVIHIVSVHSQIGDRCSTVVKVLCYNSEGRWFDPSWCQWIFH